jgi:polyisoprenoid-binding protein YceI
MRSAVILLVLLGFTGFFSGCKGAENAPQGGGSPPVEKNLADSVEALQKALTADRFTLALDSSIIYVTARKDEKVPVKGSLNFGSGMLDLSAGAKPAATLSVDLESYDSGLAIRNERVRKLFFNSDQLGFAKATLTIDTILAEAVQKLRADQKLEKTPVTGTLTFHGESKSIKASLDLTYTWGGRLVVRSAEPLQFKISDWALAENLKTRMTACGHQKVDDVVMFEVNAEFSPAP